MNESFIIPSPNKTPNNLFWVSSFIKAKGDIVSVAVITEENSKMSLNEKLTLKKFKLLKKYVILQIKENDRKVPTIPNKIE